MTAVVKYLNIWGHVVWMAFRYLSNYKYQERKGKGSLWKNEHNNSGTIKLFTKKNGPRLEVTAQGIIIIPTMSPGSRGRHKGKYWISAGRKMPPLPGEGAMFSSTSAYISEDISTYWGCFKNKSMIRSRPFGWLKNTNRLQWINHVLSCNNCRVPAWVWQKKGNT